MPVPTASTMSRPYAGQSAQQRRAERRARFLAAGIEEFGRNGYAATTIRSLCARAGLTQRYFYQEFEGMEALFIAVGTELGGLLRTNILSALRQAENTPTAIAEAALTAYFRTMRDDPRIGRILLVEIFMVSQYTETAARQFMDEFAKLLHGTVESLYPNLSRQGLSTRLLAVGLIGATHHIALSWSLGNYQEPLERVVATALRIYQSTDHAQDAGTSSR